jgi:hypothetical protein
MHKILIFLFSIFLLTPSLTAYAKVLKHKKKSHHSKTKSSSRKRRRHHHGNGPDLKAITKESSYTENPSNGVTPLEMGGNSK